ncbi:methyl-accepting chemotaxis protein [Amphritea sp. HPY]|uniref:methyl-accepting chemotaxis protein n=1 Tax=Amphritea sp. HPY TaxID=3421652 RepID=UPI003D7D80DC
MKSFNNLKISRKLLISCLLIGLVPFVILASISGYIASHSLEKQSYHQLESVRGIKARQIENFLAISRRDTEGLAALVHTMIENGTLSEALENKDKDHKNLFAKYHDSYGYYDLFMIEPDGLISYSIMKESDYNTNLITGPYKDSNLGELFRQIVKNGTYTVMDIQPYEPSNGAPAGFTGAPVFDEAGQLQLIVALQIPLDPINAIMNLRDGMGSTGESYLVGPDLLLRSDTFLDPENHSVVTSFANPESGSVNTPAAKAALAGETTSKLVADYKGNKVLSSYTQINVDGIKWALLVDIDETEAFAAVTSLEIWILVIGLIGSFAIAYISWRISAGITQPIINLAQTIRNVEQNGDFSARLEIINTDEIGAASNAVNQLLQATQDALADTKQVMRKMAVGDFTGRVTRDLRGELSDLKLAINSSAEQTQSSISTLSLLMQRLSNGDFDTEVSGELSGDYQHMVEASQHAMRNIGNAIREVNSTMDAMANGNFEQRIESELPGQLYLLKQNLNHSLEAIRKATTEVVTVAELQSQGNLITKVNGDYLGRFDEIKSAINHGQQSMATLVNEVRNSASDVAGATHEISTGNNDLSERTQSQASAIEETSVTMEQISQAIQITAENAVQADKVASQAKQVTAQGSDVMVGAINAMTAIQQSSNKISEITGLIDSIAFQTNLLALNAAVEAARAGDQGRGFAVVASEVRSLSQKSANAARDIKVLIGDTVARIEEGTQKVSQSSDAFAKVADSIDEVSVLTRQITNASQEQAIGINQANIAVTSIDKMTQQNAALVEEVSAAAESVHDQAKGLDVMMQRFVTHEAEVKRECQAEATEATALNG